MFAAVSINSNTSLALFHLSCYGWLRKTMARMTDEEATALDDFVTHSSSCQIPVV